MRVFVAGLIVTAWAALAIDSYALPPGRGYYSPGSRGGFVRRSFGPAFSRGRFSGGALPVFAGRAIGPEFAVSRNYHTLVGEHRFYSRRFRTVAGFGTPALTWWYPYTGVYPYNDYSYLPDSSEPFYSYPDPDELAAAVQLEWARRDHDDSATVGGIYSPREYPPLKPTYRDLYSSLTKAGTQTDVPVAQTDVPVRSPNQPPGSSPAAQSPAGSPTPGGTFKQLVLASWFKENGKETVFVENTETNEVEKITSEPNRDHFRIVEVHPDVNPALSEVVISNGTEQGAVRFRAARPTVGNPPSDAAAPAQTR
ncbi:MAG: hypothetical protein JO069_00825 [Verrucomicrobia bacterium]|nr:hypothetical protein [Verrucomicrobiota bacterium]